MKIAVIVVAAGKGKRLGQDKALLSLDQKPLFYHAVNLFMQNSYVSQIILVMRKKNFALAGELFKDKKVVLIQGGKERTDSVRNGLAGLNPDITHVLIHDAARPFVSQDLIKRLISQLKNNPAVICGLPCQDTVKQINDNTVKTTLSRESIWQIQTPQGFERKLICQAYKKLPKSKFYDDAQLIEILNRSQVKIILGERNNFKITYPQDVKIAQILINQPQDRIGVGVDLHRFSNNNKPLFLCGIKIPCDQGLDAVSDGDVALHAIADSICGSCGLGDIGDIFPPDDAKSKDLDSKEILRLVLDKAGKVEINNLDLTIIADKPRLAAYKSAMTQSLKKLLGIDQVNIKIKSKEGTEFFGSNDSISALAAVSLRK